MNNKEWFAVAIVQVERGAVKRFNISWLSWSNGGAYKVSIPDYKGGEVVDAAEHDERIAALRASNARLREALDEIEKFAIYGCGTKQKDVRGKQFASIVDLARAALAEEPK